MRHRLVLARACRAPARHAHLAAHRHPPPPRCARLRLAKGGAPLGFVNPLFYAHPEAFHDVTLGENKGAGQVGFKAAKGWDPATGLGTPDFQKLMQLV